MTEAQERARQKIAELVERFRQTPKRQRESYNEQETRLYFILPLFEALGWDTRNPAEMSAEEQISRGFVDFGFYMNGVPVFYLETKKIPEDINKPEWGRQAINYAWLKGVTWAVLTDFEGLKVFNAEVREKIPAQAVFLDLQWERYAEDQFEDLWLLSKEAIQAGKLDELAERYGRKARKQEVSKLLFAQLTTWRRALFKEMQAWGNMFKEDTQKLDEAVQRFLDRLIFVRTVEDRGVEPPRLQAVVRQYEESRKKQKNLFSDLLALFREMDTIYNARLFSQHQLDLLEMHNVILLDEIIKGLYDAPGGYDRYDFNAISADVLGNIYEQYLSFKATDPKGETAIDPNNDKQSKRKAQGIYYTPQFVVRYIVQQTLGKLLEEGADPYTIRVLDPACGSGSFLIEAFDVLDRWLANHGTSDDKAHPRKRRLRILQENLYGVDLDPQAVEVAQLNLLLRAAYDRDKLPMLQNIKNGNSLIDDPDVAGELAFKWEEKFPDVMANGGFDVVIGNPPYVDIKTLPKNLVDYLFSHYKYANNRINLFAAFIERSLKLVDSKRFQSSFIVPTALLVQDSYSKLREQISLAYQIDNIVRLPNESFGTAAGEVKVDTVIYVISQKQKQTKEVKVIGYEGYSRITEINPNLAQVSGTVNQTSWTKTKDFVWSINRTQQIDDLLDKIISDTIPLENCVEFCLGLTPYDKYKGHTPDQIANKAFHADYQKDETYKKLLAGNDVTRYGVSWNGQTWISYGSWLGAPREQRFFTEKRILVKQIIDWSDKRIWAAITDEELYNTQNAFNLLQSTELTLEYILAIINSKLMNFYHQKRFLDEFKVRFQKILIKDCKKFPMRELDFDNSHDVEKHGRMLQMVERMIDLKKKHAEADAQKLDSRHELALQIERLDNEIDALVYDLYGLTNEEIAIVESAYR